MDTPYKNGSSVWRWIAALLAAILLAGSPGMVYALRTPNKTDVEIIRERQQIVLQRLATIDAQISQLHDKAAELQAELERHEQSTTPQGGP